MSIHLIIDGYNLIHQSSSSRNESSTDREVLLERLARYRSVRGHRITVVFDGWRSGYETQNSEVFKGIRIIYSRLGQTADEVIKRIAEKEREKAVIITSDHEIADFARRNKAATIPSPVFENKLLMALSGPEKEEEEEENQSPSRKGKAKRASREDRRTLRKLKKL